LMVYQEPWSRTYPETNGELEDWFPAW
jgi:hypothetical protein